jgi:hypothetical protein
LVSGGSDCSFSAFGSIALVAAAAPATVCLADGFTFGTFGTTGASFGLELTRIVTGAFFSAAFTFTAATEVFFGFGELAVGELTVGAPTETVLTWTGACELLDDAGADWTPRASFEAAVVLLLTAFIELRVF